MFLMVIVSFLRFAMQKYSISQNEKQLVKPFRGLVYHVAKIQKNKRLDFKLLQNRNPTVVYGGVYVVALVETRLIASLQGKLCHFFGFNSSKIMFLRLSIGTRTCCIVSRSRTVTVLSIKVSLSTVTHIGVPMASCLL